MNNEILKVWNDINVRLTNFILDKVQDSELAKDIVQDVFLKVFSKNESLRNRDKLVSWIYQITRNEISNHFRRVIVDNRTVEVETEINDNSLTSELAECIRPIIDCLPPKYREALALSDLENVSQKELAERLNISYSGAKSRVQRAREMLKSTYQQCCDISTDVYGDVVDYKPKSCNESCD